MFIRSDSLKQETDMGVMIEHIDAHTIKADGFYHSAVNSNDYVILAGGGYKSVDDFISQGNDGHYVTALGVSGNSVTWTKNGITNNLTVPYSVKTSILLGDVEQNDVNACSENLAMRLYYNINNNNGYAGLDNSYGFPSFDNANGILWIPVHYGGYGGQLGISSDKHLYYRYISNGSFPTTVNGGSWDRIAYYSEIPTTLDWSQITSKPETATRWPKWSEVTEKPEFATRWPKWSEVTEKIRHDNEFNIVPSGYNSSMWFNYRSDADTNVTVIEYLFGNGRSEATARIRSGTIYPWADSTYDIGTSDYRWRQGYFNLRILIGTTSYNSIHGDANDEGSTIGRGYIELSGTNPYIDFHRPGQYTSDYSSRLMHGNTMVRLYYDCYDKTYAGYVATCEGNPHNITIIGVFDLYKTIDNTTTWNLNNICGPCSFSLQQNNSNTDITYKNRTNSPQAWTISNNILRVYVNGPSSYDYARKGIPYAVSCDARVMTRWVNNQPVVANSHLGEWVGSSIECLCTNIPPNSSSSQLQYSSYLPGRYIYITSSRPWGYDNANNGLGMDMMRLTGNLSYQRIRFIVFGYLSNA